MNKQTNRLTGNGDAEKVNVDALIIELWLSPQPVNRIHCFLTFSIQQTPRRDEN